MNQNWQPSSSTCSFACVTSTQLGVCLYGGVCVKGGEGGGCCLARHISNAVSTHLVGGGGGGGGGVVVC